MNPKGFWRGDGKGKVTASGRGNPDGVKVFIAANIINAELISGAWGDAVMELMDLIGEKNVFLSQYLLLFTLLSQKPDSLLPQFVMLLHQSQSSYNISPLLTF